MLKILAMLLAFTMPAFAADDTYECMHPEGFVATAPAGLKLKLTIEGDKLATFLKNADVDQAQVDKVLVFENGKADTILLAFKNGCIAGYGKLPSDMLPRMLGDAETL
jgi:hypothetical protein